MSAQARHRRRRPPLGAARRGRIAARGSRRTDGRVLVPRAEAEGGREPYHRRVRRRAHHGADRPRRLLAMCFRVSKGRRSTRSGRAASSSSARDIVAAAPFLDPAIAAIKSFDDVKLLSVALDRLTHWSRPGFLAIGDAAHAMSPIGGVGINLAIQDAVAAANILAAPLARAPTSIPCWCRCRRAACWRRVRFRARSA